MKFNLLISASSNPNTKSGGSHCLQLVQNVVAHLVSGNCHTNTTVLKVSRLQTGNQEVSCRSSWHFLVASLSARDFQDSGVGVTITGDQMSHHILVALVWKCLQHVVPHYLANPCVPNWGYSWSYVRQCLGLLWCPGQDINWPTQLCWALTLSDVCWRRLCLRDTNACSAL